MLHVFWGNEMDNQLGTLTIRAMICYSPMEDNRRQSVKRVTLETIRNIDVKQARGYFLDFKGSNPALKQVTGEWVAREAFF